MMLRPCHATAKFAEYCIYLCFVVAQCIAEELNVVCNVDVRHCVWYVVRCEVLCVMCNADVRYCVWYAVYV